VKAGGLQDLASLVATHPKLTTLKAAVEAAGLQDTLASSGPFTVFAPTNLAFKKLPEGEVAKLLGDRARLSKLLLRHVVPGTTMQVSLMHALIQIPTNTTQIPFVLFPLVYLNVYKLDKAAFPTHLAIRGSERR
jgi:uncharacterized surface protein with fasciclin (FAS1) repeats